MNAASPSAPPMSETAKEKLAAVFAHARRAMVAVAVVSAVLNVLLLSGSLYMMLVYDLVLPGRSVPTLVGLALMVLVAYAFQGTLEYVRSRVLLHFSALVDVDINRDVHSLVGMLARMQNATDAMQPVRDLDQLRTFLSGPGPSAIVDLPWMLFFIVILFLLHPYLGITVLIGGAILVFMTFLTEKLTKDRTQDLVKYNSARLTLAETTRRHAESLSALGMMDRIGARWSTASEQYLGAQDKLNGVSSTLSNLTKILRMVLQSGVLTVGALLVLADQATGGVIFASSILSSRALAPVEGAIANWRGFVAARQSWARLKALIGAMPQRTDVDMLPAPVADLAVEDLSLGPPGTGRATVQGVRFRAQAGQAVAILGPSGCGKSSLVRGLVGIWPLTGGHVRLDGADLEQWPAEVLGKYVGYLPQNVELIEGTVAENIARFDPDANSERVIAAAQLAGVHDLVLHLPDGYNTQVGPDGRSLSGGQRQRIGLARALYGDPFLLVLDEPNSNLDNEGEAALARAMAHSCARGAVVVVVAHRPAVLDAVDLVLLMKDGRAVAFGPKEQLVPHLLPNRKADEAQPAAPAPAPPASPSASVH